MKKTKAKLAFEMLEKEMETISFEQLGVFKGGYDSNGSYPPGQDCFFFAFSGLLNQMGLSVNASVLEQQYNYSYGSNASNGGVSVPRERDFMSAYFSGCGSSVQVANLSGYTAQLFQSLYSNGDKFIGNIDNGDGTFHAVTITGMDSSGNYVYDDFQNNKIGFKVSPSDLHSGIRIFATGN